jgi:Tol biopolymer transport system component/DNA-binding winged helix-turn-helix (wHTH) protein
VRYSIEGYVLDPYRRTLTRDGVEILLGERAFAVLLALVESAGQLVTKQELMDRVWGDVAVVEDNLVKAIGEIRHALGDKPAEARFVRTVHRRGYRFVAPVVRLDDESETVEAPASVAPAPRWRPTIPWVAATIAVVIVAVGLVFVLRRDAASTARHSPAGDVTPPIASWNLRAMDGVPSGLFKPAFSPASDLVVAVATDPENGVHSLFLVDPGKAEPVQLTHGVEVRGPDPVFSADGRSIWFTTYQHDSREGLVPEVMEIPAVGGAPRTLLPRASAASPHPDGEQFVAAIVTAEGTVIEVVEEGRRRRIADRGYWPRWAPDGQWVAYTTSNPEGGDGQLWVVRPDGTDPRQLTSAEAQMYGLCWAPDSEHVIYASDLHCTQNLFMVSIGGRDPEAVTRGPGSFTSPSFSRDRTRLVFAHSPSGQSILIAASPAAPAAVLAREVEVFCSAISPDGRFVALAGDYRSPTPTLSVLDTDSGSRRTVSDLRGGWLSWTPDGQSLVVTAPSPDGSARWIWIVPIDGAPPRPLTTGAENWSWPTISPDGRRLAAAREKAEDHELVIRDLESGSLLVLGTFPDIEGIHWSPGGDMVAWSGDCRPADVASSGIWVISANGGEARRLVADGAWPAWEPTGKGLIFARFLEYDGLWRVPAGGGEPKRIRGAFEPEGYFLEGLDVARSGGPVLFHAMTAESTGLYVLEKP